MSDTTVTHALVKGEVGPGCEKVDPIVVADGVTRQFGGLKAVDVEHLEIPRGQITALIGPNGAGKTTLFNLLTGFDKPNTGRWSFEGSNLAGVPAFKVSRKGMVRTFQLTKSLGRLSVLQNMLLGARGQKGENIFRAMIPGIWRSQERANTERADDLLRRFKLDAKREDFAASLSGGQRKLLEMARALKMWPLLDGFRGRAKADVGALADAIVSFSRMVAQLGERLVEAEINPIFVLPEGRGVCAADGVVVLR